MVANVNTAFALDAQALSSLKARARTAPDQALRQAATQFEAVFMNMLLKSMRESMPQEGAMDSDASRTYTGMLDQQLSQALSGKGLGLADLIVRQLSQRVVEATPASTDRTGSTLSNSSSKPGVAPMPAMRAPEQLHRVPSAAARPDQSPRAQAFVQNMLPHARDAEAATGIPARFVLAQAALESAWGRSEVRGADGTSSNNLFGIKAGRGWNGPVVEAMTTEYVNGVPQRVTQRFRAYASHAESFADYARLISGSQRYRGVVSGTYSASGFATALQQAGYATDPRYAEKITRIIDINLRGVSA